MEAIMNKVIVFDIDGTIANTEHRKHWVSSKPKNWAAWNAGMANDTVHEDIKFIWDALTFLNVNHPKYEDKIIRLFCSGRGEETREVTERWLRDNDFYWDKLYMRAEKDYRKDSIVKVELLEQIRKDWGEPFLWFDDRSSVVQAIRAQGVRVLQVCEGNF
jgi:broad specificity polyphosphatase/5'/3'-nucleotidase SurE